MTLELPPWFTHYRPHQQDTIDQIVSQFKEHSRAPGALSPIKHPSHVVFLEAPTGNGKTLIAESVRQRLDEFKPKLTSNQTLYCCTTLSLQDQVLRDYPYAKILRGRRNYPVADAGLPFPEYTAADCDMASTKSNDGSFTKSCRQLCEPQGGLHCSWCHPVEDCPYNKARDEAMWANFVVMTTAYWLKLASSANRFGRPGLVIIDEADSFEDELIRSVSVELGPRILKELKIGYPKHKTKMDEWFEWARDKALPAVKRQRTYYGQRAFDVAGVRKYQQWDNLYEKLRSVTKTTNDHTEWLVTGIDDYQKRVIFKPISGRVVKNAWFGKAPYYLLMSSTFISFRQVAKDLGLEDDQWSSVSMPSAFPRERRPIRIIGNTNMTYDRELGSIRPVEINRTVAELVKIATAHPDERILVHTHTSLLAKKLSENLRRVLAKRTVITYDSSSLREKALTEFKETPGAILLAMSMDRGIDLPHDLCRVIVIAKVPWLPLGDRVVKARKREEGGQWYEVTAVRTMVQMAGRGMRSEDDYCVTYVLDKDINRVLRRFPKWFSEAFSSGKTYGPIPQRWLDNPVGKANST